MAEEKGFFKRLVSGLAKTRENIVSGMDSIFHGFSHIDEDFYEELEEVLIMGDLGVQATEEILDQFDEQFDRAAGEKAEFLATNLTSQKALEVRTPDAVVKISPERAALMETRIIDGRPCLVIPIEDYVEVNGVPVRY